MVDWCTFVSVGWLCAKQYAAGARGVKRGEGGRRRGEEEARLVAGKQQLRNGPPAESAMRTARRTQVATPRRSAPSSPGRRTRAHFRVQHFDARSRASLRRVQSNRIECRFQQQLFRGYAISLKQSAHTFACVCVQQL